MLHLYLFSTTIFLLTAPLNLLTACLHPSRDTSFTKLDLHILPRFLLLSSIQGQVTSGIFLMYLCLPLASTLLM